MNPNSFPELPTPPESSSGRDSEGTAVPPSRRKILDSDEKIAILIAFTTIGGLLWWILGGSIRNTFNFNNWQSFLAGSDLQNRTAQQIPRGSAVSPQTPASTPEITAPTTESDTQQQQLAEPDSTIQSVKPKPRSIVPPVILPLPVPQTKAPEQPSPPAAIAPTPPPATEPSPTPTTPPRSETPEALKTPKIAFNDVPTNFWAYPFVEGLRNKQLITGISEGNFEPDLPITRAQMASLIDQAFDLPPQQNKIQFKDVPVEDPATGDIEKAIQKGFMKGYSSDSFRPEENIPRYQVLVALATGLNLKPTKDPKQTLSSFPDAAKIPTWAIDRVAAATEKGLVVNYPNPQLLNPDRPATRAEVAAIMYQALTNLGKVEKIQSEYIVTSP
jgi:hypothetical protein